MMSSCACGLCFKKDQLGFWLDGITEGIVNGYETFTGG